MSQDLLAKFTELDSGVRKAERELASLEAQLKQYEQREVEVYESLGVAGLTEMEVKLESLKAEVDKDMVDWAAKVQKVNEIIREVENRVAAIR